MITSISEFETTTVPVGIENATWTKKIVPLNKPPRISREGPGIAWSLMKVASGWKLRKAGWFEGRRCSCDKMGIGMPVPNPSADSRLGIACLAVD
jgi:hypothetical protein